MIRRIARILPIYYTVLLIVALWHEPISLANLTLTQSFFPDQWQSGIDTAWTLTLEECFYLLLPFILLLCWQTRRPWLVLACVTALFYTLGLVLVHAGVWEPQFMLTRTILGRMVEFVIGIGCAFIYRRWCPGKHAWILTLLCVAYFVVWVLLLDIEYEAVSVVYGAWAFALGAGGLILSLTSPSGWVVRLMSSRPLVYLGRISYALYLLQLARPFDELRETLKPLLNDYSNVVLLVIVLVFSAALYELVEKPAHRWILRRFDATSNHVAASAQSV